jgi:heterodisulfide reductase subunit A
VAAEEKEKPDKEEPRIGVYVCHCGLNIAGTVNCEEVAKFASSLPQVVVAKDNRYTADQPLLQTHHARTITPGDTSILL